MIQVLGSNVKYNSCNIIIVNRCFKNQHAKQIKTTFLVKLFFTTLKGCRLEYLGLFSCNLSICTQALKRRKKCFVNYTMSCSVVCPFVVSKNANLIEYDVSSTFYVTDISLLLKKCSVYAKPYIKVLASNVGKKTQ